MSLIRSYQDPFKVVDRTQGLLVVPNQYGKIQQMGLFSTEGIVTDTVTFEESNSTIALVDDRMRGDRGQVGKDEVRKLRSYTVAHFPYDDAIFPKDIKGKSAYGSDGVHERVDAVMMRRSERIRKSLAQTLEFARVRTLVTGDVYSPRGTIQGNFYNDFGITREEVAFDLSNNATEVLLKQEGVIAHIQDNAFTGDVINEVVALCSPEFMNALLTQAGVKEAYKFYTSTQEPLRNRQGGMGLDREFVHGNVRYIEYRAQVNGVPFIPAGEAYFLPMGTTDTFITYFAPAERFDMIDALGEEAYLFTKYDDVSQQIKLMAESNFLNVIRRPQLVVRAVAGASV